MLWHLCRPCSQRLPRTADPAGAAAHPLLGSCQLGYGHHMALGAATGLLFLAAGRAALRTDNEALAALLVSLYPHWPSHPSDQRCHLQVCYGLCGRGHVGCGWTGWGRVYSTVQ
jgi:hypothetical protein